MTSLLVNQEMHENLLFMTLIYSHFTIILSSIIIWYLCNLENTFQELRDNTRVHNNTCFIAVGPLWVTSSVYSGTVNLLKGEIFITLQCLRRFNGLPSKIVVQTMPERRNIHFTRNLFTETMSLSQVTYDNVQRLFPHIKGPSTLMRISSTLRIQHHTTLHFVYNETGADCNNNVPPVRCISHTGLNDTISPKHHYEYIHNHISKYNR